MKNHLKQINYTLALIAIILISFTSCTTNKSGKVETVANDPLKVKIYTLKNGLKVYLSVYKNEPRIQTMIAVKAGSKNDPAQATGLAHYLEHMLFKGTDKFGSLDFQKESVEISKIEDLFELYRSTTDEAKRKELYHHIDSISGVAAKYAIANEYDKLLSGIGAKGTNAFTSNDNTCYVNDIPSNQIDNWLNVEAERFRKPVLRLFHTELEAVYEEKNRGLDNDGWKVWEALFAGLFQKHTYGTQTTIGTIEHLKNPSMKEIMKYYNAYYVPNNMAIFMSGDFDPDKVIKQIEAKFSYMNPQTVPSFSFEQEAPITQKIIKEVYGPNASNLMLAWRTKGANSKDADMLDVINQILCNGKAGLLDKNLNQKQIVLSSGDYVEMMKDYGTFILYGEPKQNQTLEDVEKLLLNQIDSLKAGAFPEWLLSAVITDLKLRKTKQMENNYSRVSMMMNSFVNDTPWDHIVNTLDRYSKITKQDVINFAKETFNNNNYCIVYKRVGEDKSVQKVTKPTITPVQINRNDQSEFVKSTLSNTPTTIEPKFINYEQDIIKSNLKNNVTLLYNQNTENELFSLRYVFEMGSNHNKMLPIAVEYVPYLGTTSLTLAQIQQEFYKIGCEYNVYASEDQVWVSLSGLNENLDKASQLFENLFKNPQVEPITLKNLTEDIIKKREDAKKEKSNILQDKMVEYAKYGPKNASTNILTNIELAALSTDQIKNCLINLMTYNHKVLYYGPSSKEGVEKLINNNHIADFTGTKPVPMAANYELQKFNNIIYFVPYDMKQTEVVMLSSGDKFDLTQKPIINLYNAYFGGDMSSVVFQELRESKALAYSCYSQYSPPYKPDNSYYNFSYIGAQADKLSDAIEGMSKLLNDLPKSDLSFTNAKKSILQRISTERITKMDMLFNYLKAEKFNLKHDIRQTVFEKVPALKFEDVKNFQSAKIKNKPFALLLIGNKSLIDFKALQKYGTVKELTLKEIFGY